MILWPIYYFIEIAGSVYSKALLFARDKGLCLSCEVESGEKGASLARVSSILHEIFASHAIGTISLGAMAFLQNLSTP